MKEARHQRLHIIPLYEISRKGEIIEPQETDQWLPRFQEKVENEHKQAQGEEGQMKR